MVCRFRYCTRVPILTGNLFLFVDITRWIDTISIKLSSSKKGFALLLLTAPIYTIYLICMNSNIFNSETNDRLSSTHNTKISQQCISISNIPTKIYMLYLNYWLSIGPCKCRNTFTNISRFSALQGEENKFKNFAASLPFISQNANLNIEKR